MCLRMDSVIIFLVSLVLYKWVTISLSRRRSSTFGSEWCLCPGHLWQTAQGFIAVLYPVLKHFPLGGPLDPNWSWIMFIMGSWFCHLWRMLPPRERSFLSLTEAWTRINSSRLFKQGIVACTYTTNQKFATTARSAHAFSLTVRISIHFFWPKIIHRLDRKVSVVVIDGVTVGHPCCAVHNCKNPLSNNRHCYCDTHLTKAEQCMIVACQQLAAHGKKTCNIPEHTEVKRIHNERGQAWFQLQEQLQQARIAHPKDAIGMLSWFLSQNPLLISLPGEVFSGNSEVADMDGDEKEFGVVNGHVLPGAVAPSSQRKLQAQFGWKRTHNEQIIVAPCGIILARETFYGAEAVATVMVRGISHSFSSIDPYITCRKWSNGPFECLEQCRITSSLTTTASLQNMCRMTLFSSMLGFLLMFSISRASMPSPTPFARPTAIQLHFQSLKVKVINCGTLIHLSQSRPTVGWVAIIQSAGRCSLTSITSFLMKWSCAETE